jgi:hypothetical protein
MNAASAIAVKKIEIYERIASLPVIPPQFDGRAALRGID